MDWSRTAKLTISDCSDSFNHSNSTPPSSKYDLPNLRKLSITDFRDAYLFHAVEAPILDTVNIYGDRLGNIPSFIFNHLAREPACAFQAVRNVTLCVEDGQRLSPAWFLYFPQLTHLNLKFRSSQPRQANAIYHLISWRHYHEQENFPYL